MTDHLDSVKRAARAKTRADTRYQQAVSAAVKAGLTYADIGRAVGVSRQAVRQQAERFADSPSG